MCGAAYARKGDLERAVADYTEVIRLSPSFAPAYVNRGVCYTRGGKHDEAISDYTEAIRLDPAIARAILTGAFPGAEKGAVKRLSRTIPRRSG